MDVEAGERLQPGVGVLDDEPAARTQDPGQRAQHRFPLRQVDEDQPGMDEIERCGRDRAAHNVMAADLDCRPGGLDEPGHIQVGGQYVTRRSDAPGQPTGDHGPPGPDLPAAPARADAHGVEVAERPPVEDR